MAPEVAKQHKKFKRLTGIESEGDVVCLAQAPKNNILYGITGDIKNPETHQLFVGGMKKGATRVLVNDRTLGEDGRVTLKFSQMYRHIELSYAPNSNDNPVLIYEHGTKVNLTRLM